MKRTKTVEFINNLDNNEIQFLENNFHLSKENIEEISLTKLIDKIEKIKHSKRNNLLEVYQELKSEGKELESKIFVNKDNEFFYNEWVDFLKENQLNIICKEKGQPDIYYESINLSSDKRVPELEQYFSNQETDLKSKVFVFRGEEKNKLKLVQVCLSFKYYSIEQLMLEKIEENIFDSILAEKYLQVGDSAIWGSEEWVYEQIINNDESIQKELIDNYEYQTILCLILPYSEEVVYITASKQFPKEFSKIFKNIKIR